MAREITVAAAAKGDSDKRSVIKLRTSDKSWKKESDGPKKLFNTSSGSYVVKSGGSGSIRIDLTKPGGTRIAYLENFNPDTVAVGPGFSGSSDDTGEPLDWKVDSIKTI